MHISAQELRFKFPEISLVVGIKSLVAGALIYTL